MNDAHTRALADELDRFCDWLVGHTEPPTQAAVLTEAGALRERVKGIRRDNALAPIPTAEDLLAEIIKYCARTDTAESAFGMLCLGNHKLVRNLRDGKGVTISTASKIQTFMRNNPYGPARERKRKRKAGSGSAAQ